MTTIEAGTDTLHHGFLDRAIRPAMVFPLDQYGNRATDDNGDIKVREVDHLGRELDIVHCVTSCEDGSGHITRPIVIPTEISPRQLRPATRIRFVNLRVVSFGSFSFRFVADAVLDADQIEGIS